MSKSPEKPADSASGVTDPEKPKRLLSLDTYRGLVLLLLCLEGPNWGWWNDILDARPDSVVWPVIARHVNHVQWVGCVLWDLIQPSFMFMVGVSMAYSYAKRQRLGASWLQSFRHVVWRALVLILLGVFLRSENADQTYWTFEDVLSQIGLGYVFLFLLWNKPVRVQIVAAATILIGYFALFALWPVRETVGNPHDYPLFTGFFAHWNLNANPAHYTDTWFLNLFPRKEMFEFHPSGYNTLNFIPSLAIMIMGLLSGELLRSDQSGKRKFSIMALAGIACLATGLALHHLGICPLVKKTWTPTFTLFSGGWCLLILAALYGVIDILRFRKWTFFLVVFGMNSIALYVMIHLFPTWIVKTFKTHFGTGYTTFFGSEFQLLFENLTGVVVLWLICYWMCRRSLFLRI